MSHYLYYRSFPKLLSRNSDVNYLSIMKLAVISLILLTVQVFCKEDLKQHADLCIKINNLDGREIFEIHNSENVDKNHRGYQVFIECFWKSIGFLDQNGNLQHSAIWLSYYNAYRNRYSEVKSKEMADNILKKCGLVNGASAALRAINMSICLTS
ncbi:uncharacterized protein LOC116176602 [Photinus pyralis]|uniref:Uncharacterized protein n=1 Tax=Photinus pyralis TaxID=7054 RepID=A0A1Y1MTY4_PHOPY|nr:uncharacterized protein LOC116176602 [Photinus pyralis]